MTSETQTKILAHLALLIAIASLVLVIVRTQPATPAITSPGIFPTSSVDASARSNAANGPYAANLRYWNAINAVNRSYNSMVASYARPPQTYQEARERCFALASEAETWQRSLNTESLLDVDTEVTDIGVQTMAWLTAISRHYMAGAELIGKAQASGIYDWHSTLHDRIRTEMDQADACIGPLNLLCARVRSILVARYRHDFPAME